ncbi:MAG TPA: metallopeptidase family protein [Planctomycetaceae bacterium]|jgi:predicted Zn-dependent protease with MMP-like domain
MTWHAFCEAVEEAVASLPEPFHRYLENVAVDVQEEPSEHDYAALEDRGVAANGLLLGLFIGVPLTKQTYGEPLPNVIKIFRRPMEQVSRTRGSLLRNIRATVIHEFAHHFGFSEEELEAFEASQREVEKQERSSPADDET